MEPITWEGYEYEFRQKTPDWYWALGILALAGAVTSAVLGNPLFAVIILVGAFALALFSVKRPAHTAFSVGERGVTIGATLYPFETLEAFWIAHETGGEERLILKSRKFLMPFLVLPLPEAQVSAVSARLEAKLKKEELREPVAHRIMESLGF